MSIKTVLHCAAGCFLFAVVSFPALGVETHVWNQSEQSDFNRGTTKGLSIRSDGHLTLAPATRELDSTSIPYLWALAQDSMGTIFYGGGAPTGATTKIFALPQNGKPKVFAEIAGLEVHALAVDKEDRVYAAVLPDAKIYRIDGSGKAQLFFDPKCKYVWAMSFDRGGNLFVATGDSGLIFKVTPDGKGAKFFDSEETHARSMILDGDGNLIVGTEPSGLVLRITPEGKSFVLYQTSKREVTALGERNGIVYAASVGSKTQPAIVTGAAPVLPANASAVSGSGVPRSGAAPPSLPPSIGSLSAAVVGGSEIVRIEKDGYAERVWSSPTELVYCIAFSVDGNVLLGTGNRGMVYRLDSDQLSTQLLDLPPTQVTTFLTGKNGVLYFATGNVGNLYEMTSAPEPKGTLTSEVLDAREFTYWGKVHFTPTPGGDTYRFETRSGNLSNPENNWSPWAPVDVTKEGGQVPSPPARFLQYRLSLMKPASGAAQEVSSIDIAYEAKNVAPKVTAIEVAPFNYKEAATTATLERTTLPSGSPATLSLPAVGQRRTASSTNIEVPSGATLQYSKGFVTLRWNASDLNGDPLFFKVEIKAKSGDWRLLKDKTNDHHYAFDSAAFPDGMYVARITASDTAGNVPSEALTGSLESEPFTLDNTAPEITGLKGTRGGKSEVVTFTAKDALSWIDRAEYSLDGNEWLLLSPVNKVTDSQVLQYRFEIPAGQTVSVRVFDENDNVCVKQVQ